MNNYLNYIKDILDNGVEKTDRTGTGTLSVAGRQMRFDLQRGFPLLTTKKVHWKSIAHELLWFLNGSTNIKPLKEVGVSIWDEWADEDGNLGPVYGSQWRNWENVELLSEAEIEKRFGDEILSKVTRYYKKIEIRVGVVLNVLGKTDEGWICKFHFDQIKILMNDLQKNPDSRRLIVSAWNVGQVSQMALPPCHAFYQFFVLNGKLSCQLYQRSADSFLGVPFNIASYALLTHMIAQQAGLEVGDFIWTGGDCHIYLNHLEQIREQLSREPRPLPQLKINKAADIFSYKYEDFEILNYDPHPAIKGKVAI